MVLGWLVLWSWAGLYCGPGLVNTVTMGCLGLGPGVLVLSLLQQTFILLVRDVVDTSEVMQKAVPYEHF